MDLENASPKVYSVTVPRRGYEISFEEEDVSVGSISTMSAYQIQRGFSGEVPESTRSGARLKFEREPIDSLEVFEHIRHLNDPEHPLTLEQLNVASLDLISVDDNASTVDVRFTPTIPHCSMATLIGLCIRVKLMRALPTRFKTTVRITPGSHAQEDSVNKQLNDKERVAAALENGTLVDVIKKCFHGSDNMPPP